MSEYYLNLMGKHDLKPCPFCGSADHLSLYMNQGYKWGGIVCGCSVMGPEVRTGYDQTDDAPWHADAVEAWNDRQ